MSIAILDRGNIQALRTGWQGTNSRLNIGATATSRTIAAQIAALSADTSFSFVLSATGVNAATTDFRVPANAVIYVLTGNLILSCISATGGNGTLYISEAV